MSVGKRLGRGSCVYPVVLVGVFGKGCVSGVGSGVPDESNVAVARLPVNDDDQDDEPKEDKIDASDADVPDDSNVAVARLLVNDDEEDDEPRKANAGKKLQDWIMMTRMNLK
jgi:hypothetical protein